MVRLENISKSFRGKPALYPLSLAIGKQEIFGLLGHNGAGKSTAMGVLLGHIRPDEGEAFIANHSVQKHRVYALQKTGAIFETPAFYDYLSGLKNLEIFAGYSGIFAREVIEDAIKTVGLEEAIHYRVDTYSHGMRQRLALAQALTPSPEFLILDEPTDGLDPEGIQEIRHLILRLREERGITVLLSSHLLSEVEHLCDRILILHQGKTLFLGSWQDSAWKHPRWRLEVNDWKLAETILKEIGIHLVGEKIIEIPSGDIAEIVTRFVHAGLKVECVEPQKANLEEFYLRHLPK